MRPSIVRRRRAVVRPRAAAARRHWRTTGRRRNWRRPTSICDMKNGVVLLGPSKELAAAFEPLDRVDVLSITVHLMNDPNPNLRGFVRKLDTPIGRVELIVYGANFHWVTFSIKYSITSCLPISWPIRSGAGTPCCLRKSSVVWTWNASSAGEAAARLEGPGVGAELRRRSTLGEQSLRPGLWRLG